MTVTSELNEDRYAYTVLDMIQFVSRIFMCRSEVLCQMIVSSRLNDYTQQEIFDSSDLAVDSEKFDSDPFIATENEITMQFLQNKFAETKQEMSGVM